MPVAALRARQVESCASALKEKLLEREGGFGKKYLKLLVQEICYEKGQILMKGNYAALARAVGGIKRGTPSGGGPTFDLDWLPGLYALRNIRFEASRGIRPSD
jgi:hypothetical protein